jgi:MFS family permease
LTRETIEETSTRYEGWLVAVASGVGVFVSFASLLVYTFGIFLKPLTEEFAWSRESVSAAFGIAAMTVAVCSPLLGYLLDRYSPRKTIVPCLTIFGCAFASLALLTPHLPRPRHRRQRNRADGLFASRLELVRPAPRNSIGPRHVGRRARRDGASSAC